MVGSSILPWFSGDICTAFPQGMAAESSQSLRLWKKQVFMASLLTADLIMDGDVAGGRFSTLERGQHCCLRRRRMGTGLCEVVLTR